MNELMYHLLKIGDFLPIVILVFREGPNKNHLQDLELSACLPKIDEYIHKLTGSLPNNVSPYLAEVPNKKHYGMLQQPL